MPLIASINLFFCRSVKSVCSQQRGNLTEAELINFLNDIDVVVMFHAIPTQIFEDAHAQLTDLLSH